MIGYRPELDLVAVSDNGELASFGLCWYDEVNRVGEFEPVGTHPDYRGRGFGKALLLEGVRRLKDTGASACLVYPPGASEPACRLYESAGFKPIQRQYD